MSKRAGMMVAGAIVIGVVAWLAATAMAQDDVSPGGKPRTITVTSTATVKVTPDEAVVDLGVRSESATGADALAQNAKTMQAVLDALGSAGIADKDVQTTNVSLEQHTENRVSLTSNACSSRPTPCRL